MRIANKIRSIPASATLAVNAKAQELASQGKKIISLAVGEPDFPTPEHIRQAAKDALDQGFTRYTPVPGIPALRQTVADYFAGCAGLASESLPPEAVMICNGGKHALYNLLQALLDPGDSVLIPAPYWVSYPPMVLLAEGKPAIIPSTPEQRFLISTEDLERHCPPNARVLLLNSPSNPTGCHYSQDELDSLIGWAMERDIFVISDEIYDQLVYAPARPSTAVHWWVKFPDKVAVVNGLSKTMAMTGWRVGYVLAHPDLIKAMVRIQGQSTSNVCSIAQKAALAALTGPMDSIREMQTAFVRRRDLALDRISSWPGVVCPKPDGAFYLFPRLDSLFTADRTDSASLCTHILEKAGVALVPGVAFGDDRCIRFSYALDDQTLLTALDLVQKALLEK
ncbi:aspartate aminotransferase [Desulfonatronum thiosulfatophilum]|uniref:Aminotransferase n=1 Tax=Desulfonatronum thiosulfatophilum TaxID=617002 RepID=A0A1G6E9M1_9BACT|nr:pyridoxal phosphate-dependent aminotransferase [Desulfonatronum thiosulfatophilum]SDB54111.1 aspartate aminotransferase [Desulfonatronum thiosulfatophilum]